MKSIFKFFILFSVVFDVYSQNLKSPSDFLGYDIGTQFSRHSQVVDYFNHVSEEMDKNTLLINYGKTYERRPLFYAVISSEANIAEIENIRLNNLSALDFNDIKESIKDVVADESIIGQNGKKKIRIPVRGIKEYRFVYGSGKQNKSVGSGGEHNVKRGQKIGKQRAKKGSGQGTGKGSNKKGDQYYDVEVTLEELAEYLFADLQLPDLEKKQFRFITQETVKRKGYRFQGIRPRLSKKETLKIEPRGPLIGL